MWSPPPDVHAGQCDLHPFRCPRRPAGGSGVELGLIYTTLSTEHGVLHIPNSSTQLVAAQRSVRHFGRPVRSLLSPADCDCTLPEVRRAIDTGRGRWRSARQSRLAVGFYLRLTDLGSSGYALLCSVRAMATSSPCLAARAATSRSSGPEATTLTPRRSAVIGVCGRASRTQRECCLGCCYSPRSSSC